MYQDIHVADSILHDEVLAKWLAETYPKIFEIFNNEQLDNKVMEQLALNAICTELVRLQTQHKDIGKDSKIQLVDEVPTGKTITLMFNQIVEPYGDEWSSQGCNLDWGAGYDHMIIQFISGSAISTGRLAYSETWNYQHYGIGHKLYCRFSYESNRANYNYRIGLSSTQIISNSSATFSAPTANTLYNFKQILTDDGNRKYIVIGTQLATNTYPTPKLQIHDLQIFDLTYMFGEGNEPTIEKFDEMFPDYYRPTSSTPIEIVEPVEGVTTGTVFFEKVNEEGE